MGRGTKNVENHCYRNYPVPLNEHVWTSLKPAVLPYLRTFLLTSSQPGTACLFTLSSQRVGDWHWKTTLDPNPCTHNKLDQQKQQRKPLFHENRRRGNGPKHKINCRDYQTKGRQESRFWTLEPFLVEPNKHT